MPRSRAPSEWSRCECVRTTPSIEPAASLTAREMPGIRGAGIHHPAADHPGVRPVERHRRRVRGHDELTPGSGCCTFSTGKRDTRAMANGFGRSAAARRWALGAAALTTLLAALDAALPDAVLTRRSRARAAARGGPLGTRETCALAIYAVALGFVAGSGMTSSSGEHLTRLLALAIGAVVAIWIAALRDNRRAHEGPPSRPERARRHARGVALARRCDTEGARGDRPHAGLAARRALDDRRAAACAALVEVWQEPELNVAGFLGLEPPHRVRPRRGAAGSRPGRATSPCGSRT